MKFIHIFFELEWIVNRYIIQIGTSWVYIQNNKVYNFLYNF